MERRSRRRRRSAHERVVDEDRIVVAVEALDDLVPAALDANAAAMAMAQVVDRSLPMGGDVEVVVVDDEVSEELEAAAVDVAADDDGMAAVDHEPYGVGEHVHVVVPRAAAPGLLRDGAWSERPRDGMGVEAHDAVPARPLAHDGPSDVAVRGDVRPAVRRLQKAPLDELEPPDPEAERQLPGPEDVVPGRAELSDRLVVALELDLLPADTAGEGGGSPHVVHDLGLRHRGV